MVEPSAFTPNDDALMVPAVFVLAAFVELAAAGALAVVVALADEAELAGVAVEAPLPVLRRLQRSATESGAALSLPPPHAASTNAPLPAISEVRSLRRVAIRVSTTVLSAWVSA
ncbi:MULTISPECIES: hypothetical protein [Caballeronia]|uniref:hypothetical protein n=1 Tax=Caballeronia TaxID=1827195 RepID=UPI0002E10ADA|nr:MULTISPECIES: hypothetical protein [Caballeronia]MDR5766419.1 hypothetical protein [Caballeronia sp. LZ028]